MKKVILITFIVCIVFGSIFGYFIWQIMLGTQHMTEHLDERQYTIVYNYSCEPTHYDLKYWLPNGKRYESRYSEGCDKVPDIVEICKVTGDKYGGEWWFICSDTGLGE